MIGSFSRYSRPLPIMILLQSAFCSAVPKLPVHIKSILDQHTKQLHMILRAYCDQPRARMGKNVHEPSWLPGYFIKYGIERFFNAQKLKAAIGADRLDLLAVSNKYLYHVPGRPKQLSSKNYLVIAEKIVQDPYMHRRRNLNFEQAKQLCKVALRARHYDLHPSNYIFNGNKIVIIDTDDCAMPSLRRIKKLERDRLFHGTRVTMYDGVYRHPKKINDPLTKIELGICPTHSHYDDQAKAYILARVRRRETHFQQMKKRSAFLRFFAVS